MVYAVCKDQGRDPNKIDPKSSFSDGVGAGNEHVDHFQEVAEERIAEERMREIARHTGYWPEHWRGRAAADGVRMEFEQMLVPQVQKAAADLAAVFVAPVVLWFVVPRLADEIVDYVRENTVEVEGVGSVVGFSTFDFEKFGVEQEGGTGSAGGGGLDGRTLSNRLTLIGLIWLQTSLK